ncbi:MAG: hypothetical protein QM758_22955 [Armatimonas sp.]
MPISKRLSFYDRDTGGLGDWLYYGLLGYFLVTLFLALALLFLPLRGWAL